MISLRYVYISPMNDDDPFHTHESVHAPDLLKILARFIILDRFIVLVRTNDPLFISYNHIRRVFMSFQDRSIF